MQIASSADQTEAASCIIKLALMFFLSPFTCCLPRARVMGRGFILPPLAKRALLAFGFYPSLLSGYTFQPCSDFCHFSLNFQVGSVGEQEINLNEREKTFSFAFSLWFPR